MIFIDCFAQTDHDLNLSAFISLFNMHFCLYPSPDNFRSNKRDGFYSACIQRTYINYFCLQVIFSKAPMTHSHTYFLTQAADQRKETKFVPTM